MRVHLGKDTQTETGEMTATYETAEKSYPKGGKS